MDQIILFPYRRPIVLAVDFGDLGGMETTKTYPPASMNLRILFLLCISWTVLIGAILFVRVGLLAINRGNTQELPTLSADGQFNRFVFDNGPLPETPSAVKVWYAQHPKAAKSDLGAVRTEYDALISSVQSQVTDIDHSPALALRLALLELWIQANQDRRQIGPYIENLFRRTHSALSRNYLNAVLAACGELEAYTSNTPHYAEALAFHGTASAQMAALSRGNMDRITQIDAGLKLLDQAVSLAPTNLHVRVIRAYTDLNLPQFLHRGDQGWEDAIDVLEHNSLPELQELVVAERQDLIAELHKQKVIPAGFAQRLASCEATLDGLMPVQGVGK